MATVTGATKKEHDEKEMAKRSGNKHDSDKPKFKFPHYKIGDIVRQDTGHMVVTEHDKKNITRNPIRKENKIMKIKKKIIRIPIIY